MGTEEAVDVISDLMIMALPLNLLRNLQVTRKQKAGLAVVFSVGIVIIIVAIARGIEIATSARTDGILLNIWSIVESSVCEFHPLVPPLRPMFYPWRVASLTTPPRYL